MAYSYTTYLDQDGSVTDYAVPFGYLDKSYVKATVDGVDASFTWLSDGMIRFDEAPVGDLKIYRDTSIASTYVTFQDGSTQTASAHNNQNLQLLMAIQELEDDADTHLGVDDDSFDAVGLRITDVGDPSDDQDATTKIWVEEQIDDEAVIREAADASLDARVSANEELLDDHEEAIGVLESKAALWPIESDLTATGYFLDTVTKLKEDVYLAYGSNVVAGYILKVLDKNFSYEVAAEDATDYHLVTQGGVKLYALPNNKGLVYTSQLGWEGGGDISSALIAFFDASQDGISGLVFDSLYKWSGTGVTIPSSMRRWLGADYEELTHGEQATNYGLLFMDSVSSVAAANGLTQDTNVIFNTPSGFLLGGLFFDHTHDVDTEDFTGSDGNSSPFQCADNAIGIRVDKCRTDFEGGTFLRVENSDYVQFTNNYAGKQKYWLQLVGDADHGLYQGNRGEMGYLSGASLSQLGDFMKTTAVNGRGPRFWRVLHNVFKNQYRDGPDGTGGFGGWVFAYNYFDVDVAAIDAKRIVRDASDVIAEERKFLGINFNNNTCYGCGLVLTSEWQETDSGEDYDQDVDIRDLVSSGNVFLPKSAPGGQAGVAFYLKSVRGFLSIGDQVLSTKMASAGSWDASSGAFPSDSVVDTYYEVSVAGTVDGQSFSVGDYLIPKISNASTDTYDDNWWVDTEQNPYLSMSPVKLENNYLNEVERYPDEIVFRDMVYQAFRAGATPDLEEVENITFHFARFETNGEAAFTLIPSGIADISGRIISRGKPGSAAGVADVFIVKGGTVKFDVDYSHEGSDAGALVRCTAATDAIWIDGRVDGCNELVETGAPGDIGYLHLGERTRLDLGDLTRVITNYGNVSIVSCGRVDWGGNTHYNTAPLVHNMGNLQDGRGELLTISSGAITPTHGFHYISGEGGTSDDLTTISGGAVGEMITLAVPDAAAAPVTLTPGTGNISMVSSLTMNEVGDMVTMRRRADGAWTLINFYSVT